MNTLRDLALYPIRIGLMVALLATLVLLLGAEKIWNAIIGEDEPC